MKKRIFIQILNEFWLPITVAIIWTSINWYLNTDEDNHPYIALIKTFGAAFFFLSWLIAQYWRVQKQMKVETNFATVESKLISLTKTLEERTNEWINHLTGGDSYFYYKIGKQIGPEWYAINCEFVGDYTLLDNKIIFFSKNSNLANQEFSIPSLNKELSYKANQQLKIEPAGQRIMVSTIIFNSARKDWIQVIDMQKIDTKIKVHSRVHIISTKQDIEETYVIDYEEKNTWTTDSIQ
jgi:hypothetical protein